jgi:hypothetical protein
MDMLSDSMERADKIIGDGLAVILDPATQEWAFGEPGTAGEVANIVHLGERFIEIHEAMYDWASDLRGTATSSAFERIFALVSRFMDNPIKQVGQFIDQYAESLDGIAERLSNGEVISLELTLTLTIDEDFSEEYSKEIAKIRRKYT